MTKKKKRETRVLVVDDFSTMRRIIREILGQLGFFDVIEAEDGTKALQALESEPVDLVVSDWNMPEMMGVDLLKAIRRNPGTTDIPFLLVTPPSRKGEMGKAVEAGVSDYIVKPFNAESLREKIQEILPDAH